MYFSGGCLAISITIPLLLQGVDLFGGGFDPAGVIFCLGLLAFEYRALIASKIATTNSGVRVVNPLRNYRFQWEEISHFEAGRIALGLCATDGRRIWCYAVERANIAAMTGKESVVDRTASELNALLEEARQAAGK